MRAVAGPRGRCDRMVAAAASAPSAHVRSALAMRPPCRPSRDATHKPPGDRWGRRDEGRWRGRERITCSSFGPSFSSSSSSSTAMVQQRSAAAQGDDYDDHDVKMTSLITETNDETHHHVNVLRNQAPSFWPAFFFLRLLGAFRLHVNKAQSKRSLLFFSAAPPRAQLPHSPQRAHCYI